MPSEAVAAAQKTRRTAQEMHQEKLEQESRNRSPDLIDFIKRYIKASCSDDIMTYVYKLKATMQRISVALRRTTSRALMELERRAKAYPSVALAAAPQP